MPLRLKSIELHGYKTFASRTVFEFSDAITAIVGPNGSGKSNVADAIRWVLGEQSYLLLRGKKTEDMIFSGSELRPRAGMAQATVTFDNSANWLPLDFPEVELARHAFRDGRNDYLLNGHHVRLRDINEILSQAGLSERTYTILGQGLVDASLALRADERRRLFEEAAGVGLYRIRREEALKRLEQTDRNLERVLDILSELEPRLRTLERQAKRSMEFAGAQADLKVTLREWYGYHWHRAQQDVVRAREGVRAQEAVKRELTMSFEAAQVTYAGFRDRLTGLRGEVSTWYRQSRELEAKREATGRALAVLDERRRSLESAKDVSILERERAEGESGLATERLNEAEREVIRLRGEATEAQAELLKVRASVEDRRTQRRSLEEQLELARAQTESTRQGRAQAQARLDELTTRLQSQAQRMQEVSAALADSETVVRRADHAASQARDQRAGAELALADFETKAARSEAEVAKLQDQQRTTLAGRASLEAERMRVQAEQEVLEQSERSFSGFAEGARFILEAARQSRLQGARGALSTALDVPVELEVAIAAALGETLDAVLLDGSALETALDLIERDGAERAALLPLDLEIPRALRPPADPDCLGVASEMVTAPPDLRAAVDLLLGHTLVVRDRGTARSLINGLPPHARTVTLAGEVFRGDGLVIAGRRSGALSLGGPRRRRELQARLAEFANRLADMDLSIASQTETLDGMQVEANQIAQVAREAGRQAAEAREKEHRAGIELETARGQAAWHASQLRQLEVESEAARADQSDLALAQSSQTQAAHASQDLARALTEQLGDLSLEELQSQEAYWSTRTAVADEGLQRGMTIREERSQEGARLAEAAEAVNRRLRDVDAALQTLHAEWELLAAREAELTTEFEILRARLDPAEMHLSTAEQEQARLQEIENTAQRNLAAAERLLGQVQLDQVRREDLLNILREKITDDFGLVMFDYVAEVSGPVPLPFEGLVEDLPTLTELPPDLEEQLTRQRGRLRRMGAINPEAREEFERERARHAFLKSQVDDLHKAEADLKQVIAELDELTRRDFSKTFQAVDKEFRKSFVRLFGGGSARLALTDPDNLVETGIEIEARLPGRREQGLALLSGGERSLTAIALVFALLKVSPTPVCVMDEVDAMLDEANVGRFRDLLAELSKETQFVIITHNRNTVQVADVIYGVTMGRDSTSQVISLRLDQVTDELLK